MTSKGSDQSVPMCRLVCVFAGNLMSQLISLSVLTKVSCPISFREEQRFVNSHTTSAKCICDIKQTKTHTETLHHPFIVSAGSGHFIDLYPLKHQSELQQTIKILKYWSRFLGIKHQVLLGGQNLKLSSAAKAGVLRGICLALSRISFKIHFGFKDITFQFYSNTANIFFVLKRSAYIQKQSRLILSQVQTL